MHIDWEETLELQQRDGSYETLVPLAKCDVPVIVYQGFK